jgi:hypothetical protein
MDHDGPWSWKTLPPEKLREILEKLAGWEKKTWGQVHGDAHDSQHSVDLARLIKPARDRLRELDLDDLDSLFRFRLSGEERLWGVPLDNVFYVLWWDPNHEVCPSKKRHT